MSKPASNNDRRAFLLGQPLFRLTETDPEARWQAVINEAEPRDHLRTESFTPALRPPRGADTSESNSAWERLDRLQQIPIWAKPLDAWRRIALVCGAGLGKTTNFRYLESAINAHADCHGQQLAFFLEIKDLPESPGQLLPYLVAKLGTKQAGAGVLPEPESDLQRRRSQDRITLLLDSLDQAGPRVKGRAVTTLAALLDSAWSRCPIWISGRPHAFKPNRALFEAASPYPWQFVRVGQLDEPECRFLLDDARARTERRRQHR